MKFDTNVKLTLIIFVLLSIGVYYLKPPIMFNQDGSFKQFGLTRDKTIYPYWLSCLTIGIIVYLAIIIRNNEYI